MNAVSGHIRTTLRLEGLCLLVAAIMVYQHLDLSWSTFAWFFLAPDLSFLGYLAGSRIGALAYNSAHSSIGPLLTAVTGLMFDLPLCYAIALIWLAHIGFDRMLGYGLKYASGFGHTHLGLIGKQRARQA